MSRLHLAFYFKVMPKNVGIEVHLKDNKVSWTSSNYIVLKMSETVAAGRSWEITLSSSVKWSSCFVSFFGAAPWNTAPSNLKVTWGKWQIVFRGKAWLHPFASICKSMDKKREKMTLHVSQHTSAYSSSLLKGEEGLSVLCRIFAQQWSLISHANV